MQYLGGNSKGERELSKVEKRMHPYSIEVRSLQVNVSPKLLIGRLGLGVIGLEIWYASK